MDQKAHQRRSKPVEDETQDGGAWDPGRGNPNDTRSTAQERRVGAGGATIVRALPDICENAMRICCTDQRA